MVRIIMFELKNRKWRWRYLNERLLIIVIKRSPNPTYYSPPLSPGINNRGQGSWRLSEGERGWLRPKQLMPPFPPTLSSNFLATTVSLFPVKRWSFKRFWHRCKIVLRFASYFVDVTLLLLLLRSQQKHMCRDWLELTCAEIYVSIYLQIAVCFQHFNSSSINSWIIFNMKLKYLCVSFKVKYLISASQHDKILNWSK